MKRLRFAAPVWGDYLHLQTHHSALSARLDKLIEACTRTPYAGLGRPCPLKPPLGGWWSRRLTREHRLVYRVHGDEVLIAQVMRRR